MSRFFSGLMIILFISFTDSHEKNTNSQGLVQEQPKDSLKLATILSTNNFSHASILISRDTVYFLKPDPGKNPLHCWVSKLFYNPAGRKFIYESKSRLFLYQDVHKSFIDSSVYDIYIRSIGRLAIKYEKLPDDLLKLHITNQVIKAQGKAQSFAGSYFLIDHNLPTAILYQFTPGKKIVDSFRIPEDFMNITGFFLHDLDKDGSPEVFVFHTGMLPRDEFVSYGIYSLRRGTPDVE